MMIKKIHDKRAFVNFTAGEKLATPSEKPTCKIAPYGCCQDNKTFAKGPNMEGCPAVTSSQITQATPPVTQPKTSPKLKCQLEQEKLSAKGAMDMFIPECLSDGRYRQIQCYTYAGIGKTDCWCVDQQSGDEIKGTRVSGKRPVCPNGKVFITMLMYQLDFIARNSELNI